MDQLKDNERWVINFYRHSEITGALFFGRLAQYISDPVIKYDLTKHFSDESLHAWYWEDCLHQLGTHSQRSIGSYQDEYFTAIGVPTNMMEILAITQIFESRVIRQYQMHLDIEHISPVVSSTINRIMEDEKWHLKWIRDALKRLAPKYAEGSIEKTLSRYRAIDDEIYGKFCQEHSERLDFLKIKKD